MKVIEVNGRLFNLDNLQYVEPEGEGGWVFFVGTSTQLNEAEYQAIRAAVLDEAKPYQFAVSAETPDDLRRILENALNAMKVDAEAVPAPDTGVHVTQIVTMRRDQTKGSGSPMWRCETKDGLSVNVFKHTDPLRNSFHLFAEAGYGEAMDAMQFGEALNWHHYPITVSLVANGSFWNVQRVGRGVALPDAPSALLNTPDGAAEMDTATAEGLAALQAAGDALSGADDHIDYEDERWDDDESDDTEPLDTDALEAAGTQN
jgi:hypothetical protein